MLEVAFFVMVSVIMLNVIMPSVFMPSVFILSVVVSKLTDWLHDIQLIDTKENGISRLWYPECEFMYFLANCHSEKCHLMIVIMWKASLLDDILGPVL